MTEGYAASMMRCGRRRLAAGRNVFFVSVSPGDPSHATSTATIDFDGSDRPGAGGGLSWPGCRPKGRNALEASPLGEAVQQTLNLLSLECVGGYYIDLPVQNIPTTLLNDANGKPLYLGFAERIDNGHPAAGIIHVTLPLQMQQDLSAGRIFLIDTANGDKCISMTDALKNSSAYQQLVASLHAIWASIPTWLQLYLFPSEPTTDSVYPWLLNILGIPQATIDQYWQTPPYTSPMTKTFVLGKTKDDKGATVSVRLGILDIIGDNDGDGQVTSKDEDVKTVMPIVVANNTANNKSNASQQVTVTLKDVSDLKGNFTVKLIETGPGKLRVKHWGQLLFDSTGSSTDITTWILASKSQPFEVEGLINGNVTLTVKLYKDGTEIASDQIALRVVMAEIIFRAGLECGLPITAWLMDTNVSHGGIDTGQNKVINLSAGIGQILSDSYGSFYAQNPTPKRRVWFKQSNYMAGRIWAHVYDNMAAATYDNPATPLPWNILSSGNNYTTSNCVEWARHQFQFAVGQVRAELTDPTQIQAFNAAYYRSGAVVDLAPTDTVEYGPCFDFGAHVFIGAMMLDIAWQTRNLTTYSNVFEGTYRYAIGQKWIPPQGPGDLGHYEDAVEEWAVIPIVTPKSFLNLSSFFQEIKY